MVKKIRVENYETEASNDESLKLKEETNKIIKLKYSINDTIWTEKPLSTERKTIDRKWENSDCGVLMFGSSDFWGELSNEEKSGYSREAFNSNALDNSFLEMYQQVFTEMGYIGQIK